MIKQKQLFWASFVPAIAFWYLEENYSLQIALSIGLVLALIEISVEYMIIKKIHTLSKFNFFLIFILGGISIIGSEGIWFKLQPCFTGLFMGGFLFYRSIKGNGLMVEMSQSLHPDKKLNITMMNTMERNLSIFMMSYGLFMAWVAFNLTTGQWLFWKTGGFYIATLIGFVLQLAYLRFFKRNS